MRPLVYDSTRRIYRVVGEEVGGAWEAGQSADVGRQFMGNYMLRE
ncbi:MAG: hypothetical protein ACLTDR_03210 [Adlercreutzia equolifaciens]